MPNDAKWHELDDLLGDIDLEIFDDIALDALDGEDVLLSDGQMSFSENSGVVAAESSNADTLNKINGDPIKSKKKRIRTNAQEELAYLRKKLKELQAELDALTSVKEKEVMECSEWEAIARKQAMYSCSALKENSKLKSALKHQIKITEALERLISKKPRFAEASILESCVENWKIRKLEADPIKRLQGFHAMVDETYSQLDTVLLKNKLKENTHREMRCCILYNEYYRSIMLDTTFCVIANANVDICAKAAWIMFRFEIDIGLSRTKFTVCPFNCFINNNE